MNDSIRYPALVGICLLMVMLVAGCGLGSPRLEGTVLDADTGQPIAQAQIRVGEQVAASGGDGGFRFELDLGDYGVAIAAPGYVSESRSFSLTADAKRATLTSELLPRMLQGRVATADTSEPVAGLSLTYGEQVFQMDAKGGFSIPAREFLDLQVTGAGILPAAVAAAQVKAQFADDGSLVAPLDVPVEPRVLAGVLAEPDGTPVSGAEVSVARARTRTNAEGRYALRLVELGQTIVVASAAHRPVPDAAYDGQADYSPALEPYIANLQVAEDATGRALMGVAVSVGGAQLGTTDSQGVAAIRVAPNSTLQLAVSGYLTATVEYAGVAEPINVTLVPTVLQGVISETGTGAPIAQALVQVYRGEDGPPELFRTDEQGRYEILDATGVTRLFIKAPGYDRMGVDVTHLGQLDLALEPFAAQGIYVPFGLLSLPDRIYELLDFVDSSPSLNAVVIDVKGDWAHIAWESDNPVAQEIGAYVPGPMDMAEILSAAKERDIYTIARIVTFKDRVLAEGKPEWAVHTQDGALYLDGENLPWGDPFRTEVWDYNIAIALEAIEKGFDEVQFDYLRFPSEGRVSDRVYSQEATFETRTAAIAGFCASVHAAAELTPAFVSADIFGLTVWVDSTRDMGIGQRVDDIAAHMDYISPMLYPQTFNPANLQFIGISDVELYPYETLYYSLQKTLTRTDTRVRPWLQHYSGRYTYGLDELLRQRKGAEDGGATGWLFWNAKGSYIEELFGADPYSQMAVIPQPPEDEDE
jgi:hypothetical protein